MCELVTGLKRVVLVGAVASSCFIGKPVIEAQAGGPSLCTTCWQAEDLHGCCTEYEWMWVYCGGQQCAPLIYVNDWAANAETTCDGWAFGELDRMWVDCEARPAVCNGTACDVVTPIHRYRCALYEEPAGEPTCHE